MTGIGEWAMGAVVLIGAALWRWRVPLGRLLMGGSAESEKADALAELIRVVLAEIEAKRIEGVRSELEAAIRERLEPLTKAVTVAAIKNPGPEFKNPGPGFGGENPGPKG